MFGISLLTYQVPKLSCVIMHGDQKTKVALFYPALILRGCGRVKEGIDGMVLGAGIIFPIIFKSSLAHCTFQK